MLAEDPISRVACETLVTTGMALIAARSRPRPHIDYAQVVRDVIRDVGYTDDEWGICADTCAVMVSIDKQSPDIAQGRRCESSNRQGYWCRRPGTDVRIRLQRYPGTDAAADLAGSSHSGAIDAGPFDKEVRWLRPDSKSQVTVEYDGFQPVRIDTIVVSTQHDDLVSQEEIREYVVKEIVEPLLPKKLVKGEIKYHVNPTGRFVTGGPHGDCGLTGRKIIVDTYGGWGRHGGGAFSGKDPTKVDRSAAYMARHVAKNIVAAKLADRCEVQIAYAIGVSEPVSVNVDCHGTASQ